jgi:acetylornithine deacetylase
VICGPGHIAQAHKPDEYVDIAQIKQCDAFIDRLVDRLRK